jgi:AhpC/TSA antioxidant enzyme
VEQTNCPYPIFADPSKKLYSLLGMARTLSLGHKDPEYIKHTLVAGMVKSIAQGLKRIGSGDILQAGDIKQVGGEFLFEVMGGDMRLSNAKAGSESLKKVEVTWCHRMKNTRDHAELPDLKSALGLNEAGGEEETRRRSEPSWRNSGLARSLSNRRQSLSWTRTRRRSRSAGQKADRERQPIHAVNEKARIEDGPKANGHRLATEVKG